MRKHTLLCVGVAAALFGLAGCSSDSDEGAEAPSTVAESAGSTASADATEPAMPEADLEGIPDVVAVVNGVEITKEDFVTQYEGTFSQMAMQAQMSGQPVDQDALKTQTVENMVGNELLLQEADARGITAEPEAVDAALAELVTSMGAESEEAVFEMLAEQGFDEDEVREELANQVRYEQLVADEAGDTTPSDEEVQSLYDEVVAQQEAAGAAGGQTSEVPPLDEVRPQVEDQLRSEKENAAIQALVAELREAADVTINLE
jgi:hypothetical protein